MFKLEIQISQLPPIFQISNIKKIKQTYLDAIGIKRTRFYTYYKLENKKKNQPLHTV